VKLLLDGNLSDRIVPQIIDLYPDSAHVKHYRLLETADQLIWSFAKEKCFIIVSKGSDFYQRSILLGAPPEISLFTWWEL
jgi:predicted nuclease of predicted toxin-antitoxin system